MDTLRPQPLKEIIIICNLKITYMTIHYTHHFMVYYTIFKIYFILCELLIFLLRYYTSRYQLESEPILWCKEKIQHDTIKGK